MNAIGWQIGAVLFGSSFFIISIYLAKLINTANKSFERVNRLIDFNERHITEIIEHAASITKSVDDILEIVDKFIGIFRAFKFFKK